MYRYVPCLALAFVCKLNETIYILAYHECPFIVTAVRFDLVHRLLAHAAALSGRFSPIDNCIFFG
jgi:hypothetical protein